MTQRALLLVDIQNDFLPGGALAVPHGDEVVPVANRLMPLFELVIATQDWHPADHGSFASQHPGQNVGDTISLNGLEQLLWPDHCVQDSPGADFATELQADRIQQVFQKGVDPAIDSYSGFFDNGQRRSTGLNEFLTQAAVEQVVVLGLATDYCVKFTALDSRRLGFETVVIEDGCRGVDLQPNDSQRAIEEMQSAGIVVSSSQDRPINK